MNNNLVNIFALLFLTACSSDLEVYDGKQKAVPGIPINVPQLVKITTKTTYKVVDGSEKYKDLCSPEENSKFDVLPLGERYFVSFDSAAMGDSEFSVEFNDKGLVKSVKLNSEASSGVEQTTALLSAVLPFVKAPKVDLEKSGLVTEQSTKQLKSKHCVLSGTKVVGIEKVSIE
ncbi:hypothetical protein [Vibrio owensii]|uniref:hypothetical protein n=1 Tax=Vibrio owensii TaxID=696485 RepID=UPI003AAA4BD9